MSDDEVGGGLDRCRYRQLLKRAAFGLLSLLSLAVFLHNWQRIQSYLKPTNVAISAVGAIERDSPVDVSPTIRENHALNSSRLRERDILTLEKLVNNITIAHHDPSKGVPVVSTPSKQPMTEVEETSRSVKNETNQTRTHSAMPYFTQKDISRFLVEESDFDAKFHVLIFENGQFHLYNLYKTRQQRRSCKCKEHLIEVVIDSLLTVRPERFNLSSLPWQGLFDITRDNVHYPCMQKSTIETSCSSVGQSYPPVITIASVPTNAILPFLVQLPTVHYNDCIYYMRQVKNTTQMCALRDQVQTFANVTDQIWESLTPQIYWRGTDVAFVPTLGVSYAKCADVLPSPERRGEMTWTQVADLVLRRRKKLLPRCRAAIMSAKAEEEEWLLASRNATLVVNTSHGGGGRPSLPWLNVKFAGRNKYHQHYVDRGYGALVGTYTPPSNMSRFKYQIDFGGSGGTTWKGTITKLAMPGLLFHHQTPTKDYFHDELEPWVHYVPIYTNLSNLYEMFVWAETHPDEAKRIAQQGQQYAQEHLSSRHLQATFENAFVHRLGPIVDAYTSVPGEEKETLTSILQEYEAIGFNISKVSTCNPPSACRFFMRPVN